MSKRALIIANQSHDDRNFAELPGAAADARELSAVLRDSEIGGFSVTVLRDATATEWKRSIQKFFQQAEHDDVLLLHLSCHGQKDSRNRLHFIARDSDADLVEATSVSAEFLADCMESSSSRSIVLLLDCCYSGAFNRAMRARGEAMDVNVSETFEGSGRVVITSSTALQYAFERDLMGSRQAGTPSLFTAAIVHGLRTGEADLDQDGHVTVDDLYGFISNRVREQEAPQTPTLSVISVDGPIRLARNPNRVDMIARGGSEGRPVANELATELAQRLKAREKEVNHYRKAHRGAIRELARITLWLLFVCASAAGLWTATWWAHDFVLPTQPGQKILALLLLGAVHGFVGTILTVLGFLPVVGLGIGVISWLNAKEPFDNYSGAGRVAAGAIVGIAILLGIAGAAIDFIWVPSRGFLAAVWVAHKVGLHVTAPSGWHAVLTSLSAIAGALVVAALGFGSAMASDEDEDRPRNESLTFNSF
ncbi:caspase domain-containing protein [Kitasatospora griseola]|uniref:caspase family protein n=1 Tax=Kitasatospora griseola TaxID=2064 RepID=UPI003855D790